MPTINWNWAIILCRFSDRPDEPQPIDYYEDLFTNNGTGGICDYFRAVSCNALDISGSEVFGWFNSGHSSVEYDELAGRLHSGSRPTAVQWGRDAAIAAGVNLAPFRNILVLFNIKTPNHDHGALGSVAGDSVLICQAAPDICEFGFICHEMGHGFGLPHSLSANPDFNYGDGWDIMSWQTTQWTFPIIFRGTQGLATVGMNARNLEIINAIPGGRTWSPVQADFSEKITLDPLNQFIGNQGFLIIRLSSNVTKPARLNGSIYTIEFRRQQGWDRAIPRDAVLIHEIRTNGNSYIQPTRWKDYTLGGEFITPEPKIFIRVTGIDPTKSTATIRLWDIPEGSLRKEDSKTEVFLIQGGKKCLITSPALLLYHKNLAEVREVPDGGLNSLAFGPDIKIIKEEPIKHRRIEKFINKIIQFIFKAIWKNGPK